MSGQLDRLSKYFYEKERTRLNKLRESNEINGGSSLPVMSKDEIRLCCLENDGYESAELNDKLYLHFRGYRKIENLDEYTGCKALWLDSNGIETIEGLEKLEELRCLYLGKNLVNLIQGLDTLVNLSTIDLSYNRITNITNLSCCPNLLTINLSRNALSDADSLRHLIECKSLQSLDVTNNRIDGEGAFEVLVQIPRLSNLSINGNEITKLPHFRKRFIYQCSEANENRERVLGYLDRPIDEIERLGAAAFNEGGLEAEREAKAKFREEQQAKRKNEMHVFREWTKKQKELRRQEIAEGRSYYTELSEKEVQSRREEAERAAENERRVLMAPGGIAALGKAFNEVEARAKSGDNKGLSVDQAMDEAMNNILNKDKQEEEEEESTTKMTIEVVDGGEDEEEEEVDIVKQDTVKMPPSAPSHNDELEKETEVDIVDVDDYNNHVNTMAATKEMEKLKVGSTATPVSNTSFDKAQKEIISTVATTKGMTRKERDAQDELVAESMKIYNQQLQNKKEGKSEKFAKADTWGGINSNTNTTSINTAIEVMPSKVDIIAEITEAGDAQIDSDINTINNEITKTTVDPDAPVPECLDANVAVYWTEEMDMELARLVKSSIFDFNLVSDGMRKKASGGHFGLNRLQLAPRLTFDECRLHWSALDASNWSESSENQALNTVFRVNVNPADLDSSGKQPSFDDLKAKAASAAPTYLKAPTSFPSMNEVDDDDDDEDVVPLDFSKMSRAPL